MITTTGETIEAGDEVEVARTCGRLAERGVEVSLRQHASSDGYETNRTIAISGATTARRTVTVIKTQEGPSDCFVQQADGGNFTAPRDPIDAAVASDLIRIASLGLSMPPSALDAAIATGLESRTELQHEV